MEEVRTEYPLSWKVISSGDNNAPALRAFDGLTWTEWRAQCYMCKEREAWIGVQFGMPVNVRCMKIYQWGQRDYKAGQVVLQRWEPGAAGTSAGSWHDVLKGDQLAGESWDTVSFTICQTLPIPEYGRVEVSNGGYYPSEAKFTCSGARILLGADRQSCRVDGTWPEEIPTCWAAIALVVLISGSFTIELVAFGTYYYMVVRHKPPPLASTTFLPDDELYKFNSHEIYGVRDVPEDDGSETPPPNYLMHALLFPCCRIADTWHAVGQVHYFVGVWVVQLCCPFLPCIGTFFRGQMRQRFQIKGACSRDFLLWIFCIPCVVTQEAKHVDHMCDVAEEEAEVMRRAEERKQEKERRIRDEIEAKNAGLTPDTHFGEKKERKDGKGKPGQAAQKVGKQHQGEDENKNKTHETFIVVKSVMDMVDSV